MSAFIQVWFHHDEKLTNWSMYSLIAQSTQQSLFHQPSHAPFALSSAFYYDKLWFKLMMNKINWCPHNINNWTGVCFYPCENYNETIGLSDMSKETRSQNR